MKLWPGNVFTPVCHSVNGGSAIPPRQTPPRQTPPGQTPPLHSACGDTVNNRAVCILLECNLVYILNTLPLFTGRNEVVAKVMFLQVSVILFTGGLQAGRTPLPPGQGEPPWQGGTPPGPGRHPLDQADTPQDRQTPPGREEPPSPRPGRHPPRPGDPQGQADPPSRENPPGQADPPGRKNPPLPWEADSRIRSTSGRYVSYWNAFLC